MRWFLIALVAVLPLQSSSAQQQERSLIDRLLRPDMSLANSAQNKKFAAKSVSMENRGTVGTFYLQPKAIEPKFDDTRVVSTRQYRAPTFKSDAHASFEPKKSPVDTTNKASTSSAAEIHPAHDSTKSVATSNFAGERPFREQGKSQKSLDRQNPPLTVEQVRDLLNKNK